MATDTPAISTDDTAAATTDDGEVANEDSQDDSVSTGAIIALNRLNQRYLRIDFTAVT